jgi:hypothetical protein
LHNDELKKEIWNLNSGQMAVEILLIYEELANERHHHCIGHCGNLVSPAGPYSA